MITLAENIKRAATYLRCSTDTQDQSIPDQRAAADRHAHPHQFELVRKYVDEGISGTTAAGRPAFMRMIEDAQRPDCPFRYILTYEVRRFSRGDMDEAGYYRHLLKQCGIEVVYISEGFAGNDTDDIVRSVKQYLARQESKDLSKVTIRGQVSTVSKGWWTGGQPPYGYDVEHVDARGTLVARVRHLESGDKHILDGDGNVVRTLPREERYGKSDDDKVKVVLGCPKRVAVARRIFRMYVEEGFGYKTIAEILNREGIPSPRNGTYAKTARAGWSRSTIKSILENRIYTGDLVWNRRTGGRFHRISQGQAIERKGRPRRRHEWNDVGDVITVQDNHPAIIDRQTFEKAKNIRDNRRRWRHGPPYKSGKAKHSSYLLSGLIKCSCGHNYTGHRTTKGKRRRDGSSVQTGYYVCGGYLAKGRGICLRAPIPKEMIEARVRSSIGDRVRRFLDDGGTGLLRDALTRCVKRALDPPKADVSRMRERIQEIDAVRRRLVDSLSPVNKEFVDQRLLELKNEREALERHLQDHSDRPKREISLDAIVDDILRDIRRFDAVFDHGTIEEQKDFVNLFVERIEVDPKEGRARVHIRQFPAPASLVTGNVSIDVVAGVGFEPTTFGL